MLGWVDNDGQADGIRVLVDSGLGGGLQPVKQPWDPLQKESQRIHGSMLSPAHTGVCSNPRSCLQAKDEINVPIALSAFRDKGLVS